jgi:hypothetical protein
MKNLIFRALVLMFLVYRQAGLLLLDEGRKSAEAL